MTQKTHLSILISISISLPFSFFFLSFQLSRRLDFIITD